MAARLIQSIRPRRPFVGAPFGQSIGVLAGSAAIAMHAAGVCYGALPFASQGSGFELSGAGLSVGSAILTGSGSLECAGLASPTAAAALLGSGSLECAGIASPSGSAHAAGVGAAGFSMSSPLTAAGLLSGSVATRFDSVAVARLGVSLTACGRASFSSSSIVSASAHAAGVGGSSFAGYTLTVPVALIDLDIDQFLVASSIAALFVTTPSIDIDGITITPAASAQFN